MTIEQLIELALDNYIYTIVIAVLILFLITRMIRSIKMHSSAKKYVKGAKKMDRKKHNGVSLVDQTKRKRKRNSNSFSKLRQRSKNKVRTYLEYKLDELPILCRYKYGRFLKRSKKDVTLVIKRGSKTLKKIHGKKSMKQLIELTNTYDCLDEVIIFLHELPDAILNEKEHSTFVGLDDIEITYKIK